MDANSPDRPRVLVMDDEKSIRDITGAMLNKFGCDVTLSEGGEEAVNYYRQAHEQGSPFALVLLDLTIPGGMDGKEACEKILALDPEACIVLSSGDSGDPFVEEYKSHGIKMLLPKPFRAPQLKQMLDDLTGA